jgi:hypothetical protein
MKRLTTTMMIMLFAMGTPMAAVAMSHGEHAEKGQQMSGDMKHHGDMKHDDNGMHKGHDMNGGDDFLEVGKDTQEGVVATVKVKTYDEEAKAKMTKMGMDATHHVMVFFTDEKSGNPVAGGKAALKVKGPEDTSAKPVMMMLMGDGFGGDINVKEMGMYTFEIGTKLEDGKKRQFEVGFHNM